MDVARILAYSDNANALVFETLSAHPEAVTAEFKTIARYSSIAKLIAHSIGAEIRWIEKGIYGRDPGPRFEETAPDTLEGLAEAWRGVRARTHAALAEVSDEIVEYPLPAWNYTAHLTKREMFFQILNHESFHRGQISMALQQLGIDPPNFDYPFLKPE